MSDLLSSVWLADQPPVWSPWQWESVLGQARQSGLLGRLGMLFRDRAWLDAVPAGPRHHLESGVTLVERQQHEVQWEVHNLRKALRDLGAPVVLLKGAAYLMASLPPARGRLFSDVDVMVPYAQLQAAEAALFGAGWVSDERDPYNQRYYRQWMHEIPPLRHVLRGSVIDLHHTIAPPTSRFKVDADRLLANLEPLPGCEGIYVLGPVDMVLHSAVHLFQEGEFDRGLRDLLDLLDLIRHFEQQDVFWPDLVDRAHDLGLQVPLSHALRHLTRLFAYTPPVAVMETVLSIQPPAIQRVVMDWALKKALKPVHPTCDSAGTGLARWTLYVRSHALRMPVHLLLPHLARKAWMRRFPGAEKPANA